MGATVAVHPTDPILRGYGLGKLDDASVESVSKHLEDCASCQSRVAEMSSDSFLGRLRGAGIKPGSPVSAPVVSSLAGLSMLEPGVSPASPPPAGTLPPGLADHPDYEVIRELGQGGMGTVYLATNRLMGRHEVLKVVSSHLMNRRGVLDRFLVEIRNAARLHHTNIVTAYSASRAGESIIFAMEFVDGLDLAKLVKAKGALPVANACNYAHQAALGLQHADEQSMVHRDIKPSNLMLAKQGNRAVIKVLDFGLAKVRSEGAVDTGLTHEGQMLGTPDFIAPEQIGDARRADIRADIYSLGCTLYYLLTGGPPFQATSLYEILQAHHSMNALPLNLARPEVPVELAALVARMMGKEPARRFQTPADVAQALAPFFKKASANVRPLNAEISQVGQSVPTQKLPIRTSVPTQPATSPAPSAAPPARKPAVPATPEARWESLIEFKKTEPLTDPAPAAKKPVMQRPRWLWPAAVACLMLMGLIVVLAMGVLRVKTPNGTMVIENIPENAVIEVDGERVVVTPVDGKPIEIPLKSGKHGVVVKRGDVVLAGESVTIGSGKDFKLIVRRDEEVAARSTSSELNVSPRSPDELPSSEPGKDFKLSQRRDEEVTARSIPRESNVSPPSPDELPSSTVDRARFAIRSGKWTESGPELIQADTARSFSELLFGDDRWTDYDFTVDAMRVGEQGSFSLLFRSTQTNHEFDYTIGGDDKTCSLRAREGLRTETLQKYDFSLRGDAWYTARVHVRGNDFFCSIYDGYYAKETRVFDVDDDRHPRGRVGLQTFGASFRFKNIKVTSPDGRVLWEGPPTAGPPPGGKLGALPKSPQPLPAGTGLKFPASQDTINNSIGMTLKLIPAGTFMMGSPDADKDAEAHEKPQHRVRITRPFYLGVHEVTQAEYEAVMGSQPSVFTSKGQGKDKVVGQSTDRHPVENVSWLDAVNFCNKLGEKEGLKPFYEIRGYEVRVRDWNQPGYQLPTEAEWEYACRANRPAATRYSFGDGRASLGEFAWYGANSGGKTHPVGEKRPNGFDLFDTHGNVWEWCWDGFGENYYRESPTDDPHGVEGATNRVLRGGSSFVSAIHARSELRNKIERVACGTDTGFRLALVRSGR